MILSLVSFFRPSFVIIKNVYPHLLNLQKTVLDTVDQVFPSELEIKIKNGIASTNITEPYYITVQKEFLNNIFSTFGGEKVLLSKYRLVAIDTKGKAENFENYQSAALLTENSFVYYNNNNINITPLRDIQDLTVSSEIIKNKIKEINKDNIISTVFTVILFLSPIFVILFAILSFTIMILVVSVGVYIIEKIHKLSYPFKNIVKYTSAVGFIPSLIQNILDQLPVIGDKLIIVNIFTDLFIVALCYYGILKIKNINKKIK